VRLSSTGGQSTAVVFVTSEFYLASAVPRFVVDPADDYSTVIYIIQLNFASTSLEN